MCRSRVYGTEVCFGGTLINEICSPSKRIVEGSRILFQGLPLSTYGGVPEDVPPPRPPRGDGIQAGMRSKLMEEVEMGL